MAPFCSEIDIQRLLCNPNETVNLAQRLNEGAIVLVATRSGPATSAGARHIGRFMLSMLLRAAKSRNALASLLPVACYVDEFPSYLSMGRDVSLVELLSEGRKMRFSINLINQEENQLSTSMLSSLIANCETLMAGGVSLQFATKLRYPMGIKPTSDKGELNLDIMDLKPKHFAACVKGREPVEIQSKKDALGDAFRTIPAGKAGERMVSATMARVHQIMREEYAQLPDVVGSNDQTFEEFGGV